MCVCVYEGGLKSSYDDIISVVGDFFNQWDTNTATPMEEVYEQQWGLLKNKPHLVVFHESILLSLKTFQLTLITSSLSSCADSTEFPDSLSLTIHPYYPSHLVSLLGCILYPHTADVSLYCLANTSVSMCRERHLWVHLCFPSSAPYVLFILLKWFVRWEVRSRTTDILWGVASRTYILAQMCICF